MKLANLYFHETPNFCWKSCNWSKGNVFSCCYRQRVPKSKLILISLALSVQANKSFTFLSTDFIFLGVLWLPFAFLLYLDKFPCVSRNWWYFPQSSLSIRWKPLYASHSVINLGNCFHWKLASYFFVKGLKSVCLAALYTSVWNFCNVRNSGWS